DILAQSRFHLNDYVGFGFGGGFATLIAGIGEYDSITYNGARITPNDVKVKNGLLFIGQDYSQIDFFPLDNDLEPDIQNNPGSFLATIFFAEIGVGKVNRGPMAGFRYGTRFQNGLFETSFVRQNFLQFFVQWKF
ncbi:MAG: hypothetical protein KDE26_22270, partial [Bacteroidetes bacterium]|nr:hypothetical protein [Bacteroidota bacterium]